MIKIPWIIPTIIYSSLLYSLSYIESSQGLSNTEMEEGETELEMVDINNDGNIDIVSLGDHGAPGAQEHGITVWFGNGQGQWSIYANGNFGYGGIAVGDINNDGNLDVGYGMHHNYSSNDFGNYILEAAIGDGTGQNWTPWDDGIYIGDPNPYGMFGTDFADIDNDGDLDLGANSFGADDGIHIFINHLDGTWHQSFGFIGGNSSEQFLFGDVNNDGNADFCAAHQYGSIYLGDGNGGFSLADGNLPPGGLLGRQGPSLGDVDNDGDQDFSFINSNGGVEVWIWQGNNNWVSFSGGLPSSGPYEATQLCDMNIDGYIDVCAFGNRTVTVWLGNGAGNWTQATTFYTPGPGYFSALRVGADADHNGYPDIALVSAEGDPFVQVNHARFFKESSTPESLFVFPVFPRGGETFYAGSVQFVKWTCGDSSHTALIKLELSTTGQNGPWTLIAENLKNNCRYQWLIPDNIQRSSNCYIRYTAITSADTATAITPGSFTILPAGGVEESRIEFKPEGRLTIFPNPATNKIVVNIKTTCGDSRVGIFDGAGKLIRKLFQIKGTGSFKIYWDLKDKSGRLVSAGTYFVKLENSNGNYIEKVVVIRK